MLVITIQPPPSRGISFMARSLISTPPSWRNKSPSVCTLRCGLMVKPLPGTSRPRVTSRAMPGNIWRRSSALSSSARMPWRSRTWRSTAALAVSASPSHTCTWPTGRIRSRYSAGPNSSCQQFNDSRCSARIASEIASTRCNRPDSIQRSSHGRARGKYAGRTDNGPSGSVSQPGTLRSMPGSAIGTAVSGLSNPALPNDAPPAGPSGSITATATPARCRYSAVDRPATPAPITIAPCCAIVIVYRPLSLRLHRGRAPAAQQGVEQ